MKKSITRKIEELLSAMVNGITGEPLKDIIRRPILENTNNKKGQSKFPYKLLQIIR